MEYYVIVKKIRVLLFGLYIFLGNVVEWESYDGGKSVKWNFIFMK